MAAQTYRMHIWTRFCRSLIFIALCVATMSAAPVVLDADALTGENPEAAFSSKADINAIEERYDLTPARLKAEISAFGYPLSNEATAFYRIVYSGGVLLYRTPLGELMLVKAVRPVPPSTSRPLAADPDAKDQPPALLVLPLQKAIGLFGITVMEHDGERAAFREHLAPYVFNSVSSVSLGDSGDDSDHGRMLKIHAMDASSTSPFGPRSRDLWEGSFLTRDEVRPDVVENVTGQINFWNKVRFFDSDAWAQTLQEGTAGPFHFKRFQFGMSQVAAYRIALDQLGLAYDFDKYLGFHEGKLVRVTLDELAFKKLFGIPGHITAEEFLALFTEGYKVKGLKQTKFFVRQPLGLVERVAEFKNDAGLCLTLTEMTAGVDDLNHFTLSELTISQEAERRAVLKNFD